MIHWTCPSARLSANGTRGIHESDKQYPGASPVIFGDILRQQIQVHDIEKVLEDYYFLVDKYSARNLTKASDKFPAFSGIVQRLKPVLGDYLAGLWRCDMVRGLWWVKKDWGGPVSEYRAPSWSWASVDGPVECATCLKDEGPFEVKMLDHDIRLADPNNQFGQLVKQTSLTLQGRTKQLLRPLKYRENPNEDMEDLFDLKIDDIGQGGFGHKWSKNFSAFVPEKDSLKGIDSIHEKGHTAWIRIGGYFIIPEKYVLLLLRTLPQHEHPLMRFWCLLLESVNHQVFKRAGTLEGYASEASLKKWQEQTLVLI